MAAKRAVGYIRKGWISSVLTIAAFGIICSVYSFNAQTNTADLRFSGFKTVNAGSRYKAGAVKSVLLGRHWRDVWTMKVDLPVLDLAGSAGGLVPLKKSGGKQSKSLSFAAGEGGRFQFRSIDKDPTKILPPDLQNTIVADALQDGISTAFPYGAVIVPHIADAVGVCHTNPVAVVLPDDILLGDFREEFAGLVGIIEEFVINGPDETPGFAGYDKIVGTEELLAILEQSYVDAVDQESYLKARLLDILLGDWDRHFDQWRWARVLANGRNLWIPIPLDRDQVFVKYDGLLTSFADRRYIVPQFEGFQRKKPDIWSLTWQARHSDRLFLNELTEEDFVRISEDFVESLDDTVIQEAVNRLPEPVFARSGDWLIARLKVRRQRIPEYARCFYKNLAGYAEIVGRDRPEVVEIDQTADSDVTVKIFPRDIHTGEKNGSVLYERLFKKNETKEIRVYLQGGNDKVEKIGRGDTPILFRLIGGSGEDQFVDRARGRTVVYDTQQDTRLTRGEGTVFKSGVVDSIINFHSYRPYYRSHGHLTIPVPFLFFNSDDGLTLSAGVRVNHYGFRKEPYASSFYASGQHAVRTGATKLGFTGRFVDVIGDVGVNVSFKYDPLETINFYGLGNESRRNAELESADYYRVFFQQALVQSSFFKPVSAVSEVTLSAAVKQFKTDLEWKDTSYIKEDMPYGVNIEDLLEISAGFSLDSRDERKFPTRGLYLDVGCTHFPAIWSNKNDFTRCGAECRIYLSPVRDVILAFRVGGEKIWGIFPFYEAVFLGGLSSVRAFRDERFGGDTAVRGGAELRFKVFRPKVFVPMDTGLFAFADGGRVWVEENSPGDWHNGAGGGIWFAPIYRAFTFSIGMAFAGEGSRLYLNGGFAF